MLLQILLLPFFCLCTIYTINVGENNELRFTGGPSNVNVGDTIVWEWLSIASHSIIEGSDCKSKQNGYNSGSKRDGSFRLNIESKHIGVFNYFCGVSSHCLQGMSSSFIVKDLSTIPKITTTTITTTMQEITTNPPKNTPTNTIKNSSNKNKFKFYNIIYFLI